MVLPSAIYQQLKFELILSEYMKKIEILSAEPAERINQNLTAMYHVLSHRKVVSCSLTLH
jgi:hypothetical protein